MSQQQTPDGNLMIRTLAMPSATNPNGDIFGGWVVSQMDLAAGSMAVEVAKTRVVTVAIESMAFLSPVKVGDFVSCYAKLLQTGASSMRIQIQTWVSRAQTGQLHQVTEGVFTFVAIGMDGRPIPVFKS